MLAVSLFWGGQSFSLFTQLRLRGRSRPCSRVPGISPQYQPKPLSPSSCDIPLLTTSIKVIITIAISASLSSSPLGDTFAVGSIILFLSRYRPPPQHHFWSLLVLPNGRPSFSFPLISTRMLLTCQCKWLNQVLSKADPPLQPDDDGVFRFHCHHYHLHYIQNNGKYPDKCNDDRWRFLSSVISPLRMLAVKQQKPEVHKSE